LRLPAEGDMSRLPTRLALLAARLTLPEFAVEGRLTELEPARLAVPVLAGRLAVRLPL
jgi:hypothetical protein